MLNDVIKADLDENSISTGKNDSEYWSVTNYTVCDPDQLKDLRLLLVKMIFRIISYHNWSQKYAANILKKDQPKISQIKNFKTEGFSLERLLKFFALLGWRMDIKLTK